MLASIACRIGQQTELINQTPNVQYFIGGSESGIYYDKLTGNIDMSATKHPVSTTQLDDFKRHALEFAVAIQEIDPSYILKGRKRVDSLAQACGYDNHGHLVTSAKGYKDKTTLYLFLPESVEPIAKALSNSTSFKLETVTAAMINASHELYEDTGWTAGDVERCGDEVFLTVFPGFKKTYDMTKSFTSRGQKIIDSFRLPKNVQQLMNTQRRIMPSGLRTVLDQQKNLSNLYPQSLIANQLGKTLSATKSLDAIHNSNLGRTLNTLEKVHKLTNPLNNNQSLRELEKQTKLTELIDKLSRIGKISQPSNQ